MQECRVDVRRVNKEIRPVAFAPRRFIQLSEIRRQLSLAVAPGEIGVALRVTDLAQPRHHRRRGERFGEEDHFRVQRANIGDQPLPERQWFGVRIVDAKDLHALFDPANNDVAQLDPQARNGVRRIEVDVDDVLIFLRRILRVFDRAVRAPVEPARMLLEPRVILGTLNGEVEGDFQTVIGGGSDQSTEVLASAELRVNGFVAALLATDGIRAAGIIGAGGQGIVAPLAMGAANRVDRREIEYVEAHVLNHWQTRVHIVKSAMTVGIVGDRARKQFVPTGKFGQFAFDVYREFRTDAQVGTVIGLSHQLRTARVQEQRDLLGFEQPGQFMVQRGELFAELTFAALGGLLHHAPAFLQLQRHRYSSIVFLLQFILKTGELVDPRLDAIEEAPLVFRAELALPAVIALIGHDLALPGVFAFLAPADAHREFVVTVGKHLAGDHHLTAGNRLHGELPAIEGRHGVFDGNARQQQRLRQRHVRVVAQFRRSFSSH
ncbi:hypothetical protein D3C84_113620 [compost metagenome]